MHLSIGSASIVKIILDDIEMTKIMLNGENVLNTEPQPLVQIRYTSTDDLTSLDAIAVGGTAEIVDNGDGTYDLLSYDACEFIALADNYYATYYFNITAIEVIKGSTLQYLYYNNASPFNSLPQLVSFDASGLTNVVDISYAWDGCYNLTSFDTSALTNAKNASKAWDGCRKLVSFDASGLTNVENLSYAWRGCSNLVCFNELDTTSCTDKTSMFEYCTSLVQPNAAAQADLTGVDGAVWVNTNPCP